MIIAQSNENTETEIDNLRLMERFRVDGIILCPCRQSANEEEYVRIQKEGTPIVFYDRAPADSNVSKVVVDNYVKSFFMVEHLIRGGRRRIVHLQGPLYIHNATERAQGYKEALAKFKIPFDASLVIKTGVSFEDGRLAIEQLLRTQTPFDALFAFTDTLAIGAMNCLRERNIKIPQQVAVAGFSGTILSTIVNPQLTTVEQPLHEMGRMAAELMMEKIHNPAVGNKIVVLDAEMKFRGSSDSL